MKFVKSAWCNFSVHCPYFYLILAIMTLVAQLLLRHTLGTTYMNMQKKTLYCQIKKIIGG